MQEITAVLNSYKRPWALPAQYDAVKNQSVAPKEIFLWQNCGREDKKLEPLDRVIANQVTAAAISSTNFGVWARFAFALNATTEYICILDDDTIPGHNWFKNCLDTMKTHEGLLGTNGVIFEDLDYNKYTQHGWAKPNEEVQEVDIVGHAWFGKREWLGAFWRDAVFPRHCLSGEDIHFSYSIQKYLGLKTYVPPHPRSDMTLWGSMPDTANQLGVDANAISVNYHGSHFGQNLKDYKEKGFKYMNSL